MSSLRKAVVNALDAHIKDLNFSLNKYEIPMEAFISPEIYDLPEGMIDGNLINTARKIYLNEVETGCRLLDAILSSNDDEFPTKSKNLVNLRSAVMGGKTQSTLLSIVFISVYRKGYNELTDYLYLCPRYLSVHATTQEDWDGIEEIYRYITFRVNNQDICFEDVHKEMTRISLDGTCNSKIFPLTNRQTLKSTVNQYLDKCKERGSHAIIYVDELEDADNKGGIKDRITQRIIEEIDTEVEVEGIGLSLIPYSATGMPFENDKFTGISVNGKLGKDYIGINFLNGVVIDPDVAIITPLINSSREMQSVIGDLTYPINIGCLRTQKQYNKFANKNNITISKEEYENYCMQFIANAYSKKLECYKNQNVTIGALIRLVRKNDVMNSMIEKLKRLLPDVVFIKFYGEANYDHMKKRVKECERDGKDYIILVTGHAGMAERFPRDCFIFIDCTNDFSTTRSGHQGMLGRSGGYRTSIPCVILSDENAKWVREYIRTRGKNLGSKKPSDRTYANNNRVKQVIEIHLEDERSVIQEINQNIIKSTATRVNFTAKKISGVSIPWNEIFPGDLLERLEEIISEEYNADVTLLRPGQTPLFYIDKYGVKTYHEKEDGIFFAHRRADSHGGNGLNSGRYTLLSISAKQSEKKDRGLEPHLHFLRDDQGGFDKYVCLQLTTLGLYRKDSREKKNNILPNRSENNKGTMWETLVE